MSQVSPSSVNPAAIIVPIVLIIIGILYIIYKNIKVVKQKEVIVVERLGKFHKTLQPGVHFLIPFIDTCKGYSVKFYKSNTAGISVLEHKVNEIRISTQQEVLDFPSQKVITRDNAEMFLDALLAYKIVSPAIMVYSVTNLPNVLSKLLQAQLRSVAGNLDVDQIIEESSSLDVLLGLMDEDASRWGIKIMFVKIQKVEASPELDKDLDKKKRADLKNKEIVINAKSKKQTAVIRAEGARDSAIKQEEGAAQEVVSRARGDAQARINFANAEARTIKEISRSIKKEANVNPCVYLLATKYLEMLQDVVSQSNTETNMLPQEATFPMVAQEYGMQPMVSM